MSLYSIAVPEFLPLVLQNAQLEVLGEGFAWLEGPVWFADAQMLLLSDIPNNRVLRWCEQGVSVFAAPSEFANGHARDRQGRLISCRHRAGDITRRELDGSLTVLADRYEGKRLNSPNDVVVKQDGSIWFTDPPYGINTDYEGGKRQAALPATVYRLEPESGALEAVITDITGPNGLAFSPDESRLYVSESGLQFAADPVRHIRVYALDPAGRPVQPGRIFAQVAPGYADGMKLDEAGNIWSSAGDGVHCISPQGELLGKIVTNCVVSNLAFGGRSRSRLFICAGTRLLAIYTNTRGAGWP